jgi:flagellar FliL protein
MSDTALAADASAADAPAIEAAADGASKKRLVLLVAGVLVLGGLGTGAWLLVPKLFGPAAKSSARVEVPVKATVPLGAVVVNLNGEARRYLRVGVSLGVADPKDGKVIEEHRAQLSDLLISVLAATEVEVLMSDEGKTKLKQELLTRMREQLHLDKVGRVYFTEFVIQ